VIAPHGMAGVSGICISRKVPSIKMVTADLVLLLAAVTTMVATDGYSGYGIQSAACINVLM